MGVVVDGRDSRNNDDPHPARLSFASAQSRCFASAFLAPRTAAEGRLCLPTRGRVGARGNCSASSTTGCALTALLAPVSIIRTCCAWVKSRSELPFLSKRFCPPYPRVRRRNDQVRPQPSSRDRFASFCRVLRLRDFAFPGSDRAPAANLWASVADAQWAPACGRRLGHRLAPWSEGHPWAVAMIDRDCSAQRQYPTRR